MPLPISDNDKLIVDEQLQELIDKIKRDYLSKGEVPYTASKIESGYIEDTFSSGGSGSATITFPSPMPDVNYTVVTGCDRVGVEIGIINKTVNGFTLVVANNNVSELLIRVDYTAFELFELTTIAEIESDIATRLKIVFDMADIESPAENQTVLYMGETTTTEPIYKQGGIYEYDGTAWQLKSADNITLDDALDTTSNNAVKNSVIATEVNKRLTVTDTMPTASADYLNQTRLYIGSTTNDYQEGGIYKCESDGQTPQTYSWNIKNKADIDISGKQDKTLETPLTIGGTSRTTVEGALGGLNGVVPSNASASNKLMTRRCIRYDNASDLENAIVNLPDHSQLDFVANSAITIGGVTLPQYTAWHIYRDSNGLACIGGVGYSYVDGSCYKIQGSINSPKVVGLSLAMQKIVTGSDLTSTVTSGSNAPITSGGVYKAMGRQLPLIDLGTSYTAELKADISSGKFEKAVVGGYLTINGHVYYFAHPDYWLHTGDMECTTHHMLVIPADNIGTGKMNNSNITTGGYAGSDIKTGNNSNTALAAARAQIIADFGAANILTHRELFTTAVTDGKASNWAWADSDVDLMNEVMVYGCNVWGFHPGYETGIDKCQLKLFQERPDLITTRSTWWLRGVVSAAHFAYVANYGRADYIGASSTLGVRPVFAIC